MLAWRRTVTARRVSLALKSGPTISGYLVEKRGDLLLLDQAQLHEADAAGPVPLDGRTVVERTNVAFLQVLPPLPPPPTTPEA